MDHNQDDEDMPAPYVVFTPQQVGCVLLVALIAIWLIVGGVLILLT